MQCTSLRVIIAVEQLKLHHLPVTFSGGKFNDYLQDLRETYTVKNVSLSFYKRYEGENQGFSGQDKYGKFVGVIGWHNKNTGQIIYRSRLYYIVGIAVYKPINLNAKLLKMVYIPNIMNIENKSYKQTFGYKEGCNIIDLGNYDNQPINFLPIVDIDDVQFPQPSEIIPTEFSNEDMWFGNYVQACVCLDYAVEGGFKFQSA